MDGNPPDAPRVIVVDDDPDTLAAVGHLPTMMGIDGVPAATCEAARYATTVVRDPDMVITDANFIDGDGAAEIMGRYGCATLVISGQPAPDEHVEGIDWWLTKPVDLTVLRATIKHMLARAGKGAGG